MDAKCQLQSAVAYEFQRPPHHDDRSGPFLDGGENRDTRTCVIHGPFGFENSVHSMQKILIFGDVCQQLTKIFDIIVHKLHNILGDLLFFCD